MRYANAWANVNPKVIGGGGKKRKTRKTKRNYKKGGYKYKSAYFCGSGSSELKV